MYISHSERSGPGAGVPASEEQGSVAAGSGTAVGGSEGGACSLDGPAGEGTPGAKFLGLGGNDCGRRHYCN